MFKAEFRKFSKWRLLTANEYLYETLQPDDLLLLKGAMPQDHLDRIILDRINPIDCWRPRCTREVHCKICEFLHDDVQGAASDKISVADNDIGRNAVGA